MMFALIVDLRTSRQKSDAPDLEIKTTAVINRIIIIKYTDTSYK